MGHMAAYAEYSTFAGSLGVVSDALRAASKGNGAEALTRMTAGPVITDLFQLASMGVNSGRQVIQGQDMSDIGEDVWEKALRMTAVGRVVLAEEERRPRSRRRRRGRHRAQR